MKTLSRQNGPIFNVAAPQTFVLLLGFVFALLSGVSKAQTNAIQDPITSKDQKRSPLYIKVFGTYGLLTPGSYRQAPTISFYTASAVDYTSFKIVPRSFGGGPRVGVGIIYVLNDFVNVGVDGDLLTNTISYSNTFSEYVLRSPQTRLETNNINLQVVSVTPNVTFKALSTSSHYFYVRLGAIVGKVLNYKSVSTSSYVTAPTLSSTTYELTYTKNSVAFGYQAAIGVQFKLSTSLRWFAEIVAINQSFKPQQLSTVSSIGSGSSAPTVKTTLTDFVEESTNSSSGNSSQPVYINAINSIGVGFGLALRL